MRKIFGDIKKQIKYAEGGIVSKQLAKDKCKDVTLFCMGAGTEISEHTSTKEGIVFVIEGKGKFNLQGEEIEMIPGKAIYMEKDAVHSLKAEKNMSFLLVLFY